MRKIKLTSKFDKDLKKIGLSAELIDVLHHLIHVKPLPAGYVDHPLKNDNSVELYRLNTHSELFKN